MNKIKILIISTIIFLSQLTCNLQSNTPVPDRRIYGTWVWVNTRGYHNYDPPPFLLIKFDSNGILSVYGTDTLLYRGIFTIKQDEGIHCPDYTNSITVINQPNENISYSNLWLFEDVLISGLYQVHDDTLQISDCGMMLSWFSSYIRTNLRVQ